MAPAVANADLLHLLAQNKVSDEIQKTLLDSDVTSVRAFSAMFSSEDDLRAVLKKDFGFGPDTGASKPGSQFQKW